MRIEADKAGLDAIHQLCDIALKTGGMQNRDGVNLIIDSLKELPPPLRDPSPLPTIERKP